MKTYRIFIASSSELIADRQLFELMITRQNLIWKHKGIRFEVSAWEDFDSSLSLTRKQDEYNQAITNSDLFVLLFWSKVGNYTEEEFDTAYKTFQQTKLKPKIFTYYKTVSIRPTLRSNQSKQSVINFQNKLLSLGHFYHAYSNFDQLENHFTWQLLNLEASGFLQTSKNIDLFHDLTRPPFKPGFFIGREEELQFIHDKLFLDKITLLMLNGEGGIGKTSLASEFYRRFKSKYLHSGWLFCEGSISDSLLTLANTLEIVFEENMKKQERVDLILTKMENLPGLNLLIFDNVNEPCEICQNQNILQCLTNFHIIITSRINLFPMIDHLKIERLSIKEGLEIFKKHYPRFESLEYDLFESIWTAIDGNTQVIEILSKNINVLNLKKSTYSLKDMLSDIQSKGLLRITDREDINATKPTDLISAMYDLGKLTPLEIQVLSFFAVLPGEKIDYLFLESLVGSLVGFDATLDSLSLKGWIDFNPESRTYKCSPVIQGIVRHKNRNLSNDCQVLVDSLNEKLDMDVLMEHPCCVCFDEVSIIVRFGESVLRFLPSETFREGELCEYIGNFFTMTGDLPKALLYYSKENSLMVEFFKKNPLNIGFKRKVAISCEKLGDIYFSMGDRPNALDYFLQNNQLMQELFEQFPENASHKIGLASSYLKLGNIFTHSYDFLKALHYYFRNNQLMEELFKANPDNTSHKNGLANSYSKLGNIYFTSGEKSLALEYYNKANHLMEELSSTFPYNTVFKNGLAFSYSKLGNVYSSLKNFEKACIYCTKDNHLMKELNLTNPENVLFKNGLAISFVKLATCLQEVPEQKEKACEFLETAIGLWEDLIQIAPAIVSYQRFLEDAKKMKQEMRGDTT